MTFAFTNAEEDMAASFLRTLGFVIIARNTRQHGAELDIVAKYADEFLIAEVKRYSAVKDGDFPALSHRQRSRLIMSAKNMQAKAGKFLSIRIALLMVNAREGSVRLFMDV